MKDHKQIYTPLKLRAVDDKDLSIFSDCIYQSILLTSEMKYDKKNKFFLLALERFTWEIAKGKDYNLKQVLAVLTISGVEKIDDSSIFFNNLIYNVLSINSYDNTILILLNDNKIISLETSKWTCFLEDIGKPNWPAVTPTHLRND
ncbi:MAG: DUF2948 family protein [Pseudomonadota bacterium]|nr:DUF2948 family protein [Pseudomonadota bacterium]